MIKFKTNLFGIEVDSSTMSAADVEDKGQQSLDSIYGVNKLLLHVDEFDNQHIKVNVERSYANPKVYADTEPGEILQVDLDILFPHLAGFPSWGKRYTIKRDIQNLIQYDLKDFQILNKGSRINTFESIATPQRLTVVLSK